jgi:HK97 family phage portal protein
LTRDGFTPISPISVARESIGTLKKQEKFIGSFYENGTLTRGVLKVDTQLSKNAKDAVRQAWMDANTGEDNASKIAVLDSGVTFENITIPLQDAEFIASQKFGVEQIARIFNVPAHMIGDLSHATFSNIEQMSMDFIQNTIMPETQAWEEELNYKLFTTGEQKKGFYVKFNLTAALRGDSISRGNYYKTMSEIGAYSINEIRDLEEMDAIGPAGDVHRVDLNHVSIQIADEYQLAKANAGVKGGE